MIEHCPMIYTIAKYRLWTSNKVELPLTGEKIQQLASECKDDFLEKYAGDGETRVQLIEEILKCWRDSQLRIVRFEDENQDEELVHAIVIEPEHKRVTLIFRGTVTKKDFQADLRALQVKADISGRGLPGYKHATLHQGFYRYLCGTDGNQKSRYEVILDQLKEVFLAHPGFQLYVTGT